MAKNLLSNVYAAGFTGDPSAAGYAAPIGSLLPRLGTTELWQKFGAADTDWSVVGSGAGAYQQVTSVVTDTTASLVDVVMASMSLVVASTGSYLCIFNGDGHNQNASGFVYVDGVPVPASERHIQSNNDKSMVISQIVALTVGQTVTVRWRVDGNTGTVHERNLTILRVA